MKIIRRSCRSDTWEYLHTCACLESRRFLKFWEQRPLTPKFWSNCSPSKGRLSTTYNRFSLWQSFCIYHFTWQLALTLCTVQSRMVSYPLMTLALHSSKLHLKSTLTSSTLWQRQWRRLDMVIFGRRRPTTLVMRRSGTCCSSRAFSLWPSSLSHWSRSASFHSSSMSIFSKYFQRRRKRHKCLSTRWTARCETFMKTRKSRVSMWSG